ncbi:carboxypeptidase regulatory-like domain-containing protein [Actinomadura sp. HBU206391]|nr:carboxypeptidase regulatory-like domain-containing protein [Actinomadura sp. HBU206391]
MPFAALMTAGALILGAGAAQADPSPQPSGQAVAAKADTKVLGELADDGKTTFWVYLKSAAGLDTAARATTKAAKGRAVYEAKTRHATTTQAGLRRLLDGMEADYESFWIVNALQVTGDKKLLETVAARPEVARIDADEAIPLPEPVAGRTEAKVDAVEWNVDRVNAPRVWDELGVRGEGIVVANIDSGVQFDHPAVRDQYRGRNADGTYSHDYNWFDPAGICDEAAPCDNNDHGTHTMGTMVGDDGGANKIGVAPGAKWIAAKGCETDRCSQESLLRSGEWIIAPTDLNGENARADLAPDIVNNSWGGDPGFDPWYKETVDAWIAAGIFPALAGGNEGPDCDTSGSPGNYTAGYSSGSFNVDNVISDFSSRGPGEEGELKPNIAAPGEDVRSSIPGGYDVFSGTSMASPHTSATVALMWSAAPTLQGDIDETRRLLDHIAVDVDATTCGGTAADNNVFGEGRLDAFAAVSASPRGALGGLTGHVTSGGAPLEGATVSVDGPLDRTVDTGADGAYTLPTLMVGDYTITVGKYGYVKATGTVTITENQTATRDFAIDVAPSGTISGTVRTSAGPLAGATVEFPGTPVTATTDADGRYRVTLPHGEYDLRVTSPARCADPVTTHVTVSGDATADITLPDRLDQYGYACSAAGTYAEGTDKLALTGDDNEQQITLPFPVVLYGATYRTATVGTNGLVSFTGPATARANGPIPAAEAPNAALYPFWDDLFHDSASGVYTGVTGTAPHRSFVVEWRNVAHYSDRAQRLSFSALISEDGRVGYRYKDVAGTGLEAGAEATIGLENAAGTDAFQYSVNSPAVTDGTGIAFRTTRSGVVHGKVTDANDGRPVEGATAKLSSAGQPVATATTGADGAYVVQVPTGAYDLEVTAPNYETATRTVTVTAGDVTEPTAALRTGRITSSGAGLEVVIPAGQSRSRSFELSNTGGLAAGFTIEEATGSTAGDVTWLSAAPPSGTLAPGAKTTVHVSLNTAGVAPGTVLDANLLVRSSSGRAAVLTVPVKVVVPRYQTALDNGAGKGRVDTLGDTWSPDQAYRAGSAGYQGSSSTRSTSRAIAGTSDPALYQTAREGMYEYRYDNVPNGVYTVELNFAELGNTKPNKRIFDVLIEGAEVLPSLDIALEAGNFTALKRTYQVTVADGQLNVRFVAHSGYGKPLVNAIRVTDRPDKTT